MTPTPTPTLHCGIQNVPRDGSGRFAGGADALFEGTELHQQYQHTHSFAELFATRTLDRMVEPTLQELRSLADLVEKHATEILDGYSRRMAQESPPGGLRIFIDVEARLLGGREPYADAVYGERGVRMMGWLCNRVEFLASQRGWDVKAAPYRPLRPTGLVHARPSWLSKAMPIDFELKWGAAAVGELLDREVLWIHAYQPQDPARMRGATHEGYTRRQVAWALDQAAKAGAAPQELWVNLWLEDEVLEESMAGMYRGVRAGIDEHKDGVPADWHVMVGGGWKLLRAVLGPGLREREPGDPGTPGEPGEPTAGGPDLVVDGRPVDAAGSGRMMAELWNEVVVAPFEKVFGGQGTEARRHEGTEGAAPDLEDDVDANA